ncbi:MAG: YnfA family protein [Methylococcales bacterium]
MSYLWFIFAGVCEIAGCYAFWAWIRLNHNPIWLLPGILSLLVFAWALTNVQADFAGRAFAAYGGIYIVSSLIWMRIVENTSLAISDWLGAVFCLIGATIILYDPI